jgi:hypothetical protein
MPPTAQLEKSRAFAALLGETMESKPQNPGGCISRERFWVRRNAGMAEAARFSDVAIPSSSKQKGAHNMANSTDLHVIASKMWFPWLRFYVSEKPGDGGVDWGYTTDPQKAIPLNSYWQRRFAADCRRTNSVAMFT